MRASRATKVLPWCLSCLRRGARRGASGSSPRAWPGCLAPAWTLLGCPCPPAPPPPPLLRLFAMRRGLLLHMATMPAQVRVALPRLLPKLPATRPAPAPPQGAQAGRAPRLQPLQRAPVWRSGNAPLGASPRLRRPLPRWWRRSRPPRPPRPLRPRLRPRPKPSGLPAPMTTCRMLVPVCPRMVSGLPLPRNRRTRPTRLTRLPGGPRAPWTSCAWLPRRLLRFCVSALKQALAPTRMPPELMLPMLRPCWPRHWPPSEFALAATLRGPCRTPCKPFTRRPPRRPRPGALSRSLHMVPLPPGPGLRRILPRQPGLAMGPLPPLVPLLRALRMPPPFRWRGPGVVLPRGKGASAGEVDARRDFIESSFSQPDAGIAHVGQGPAAQSSGDGDSAGSDL